MLFSFTTVSYATPTDFEDSNVEASLNSMADGIYEIYLFLRNRVAIPLIILSIASCGFRVLAATFFESGPNPTASVYKQFIVSVGVLGALFVLPKVVGYVRELLEASAWKPTTGVFRHSFQRIFYFRR